MPRRLAASAFSSYTFLLLICFTACNPAGHNHNLPAGVQVMDEKLELHLVAQDPDVVTPIGIAIDSLDRVFVLESHTHSPLEAYDGPEGDLIKILSDSNDDGVLDSVSVFAQGFQDGMNLKFSAAGALYLVTAKAIWVLTDQDQDGTSDSQQKVLELVEPASVYDHAALLGITMSNDGWLYISRGNTGGNKWRLEGTDGTYVEGYGDGGNIVRSRLDGSDVQEVATGFWNPFDLTFTHTGRLMTIDNDPDSRGPNRLVDVIEGGDFGYKSMYGGSGIHPYLAWNGELPGTLPFAAPLGEAPSGMFDTAYARMPGHYLNTLLVTIWEESKIVGVALEPNGTSVRGKSADIIVGDSTFRPVAFASDSKGNIYFTDWARRTYPNHGKGRVWKLQAKSGEGNIQPQSFFEPRVADSGQNMLASLEEAKGEKLIDALRSSDPFIRATARRLLDDGNQNRALLATLDSKDQQVVLEAGLILLETQERPVDIALKLLQHEVAEVRKLALSWIGQNGVTEAVPFLQDALANGNVGSDLFETYLATVRHLQPGFVKAYAGQTESNAKKLVRQLPPGFLSSIVENENLDDKVRATALYFAAEDAESTFDYGSLLTNAEAELTRAIIWQLRTKRSDAVATTLMAILADAERSAETRIDALQALAYQGGQGLDEIVAVLDNEEEAIRIEAIRAAAGKIREQAVQSAFEKRWTVRDSFSASERQMLSFALGKTNDPNSAQDIWDAQSPLTQSDMTLLPVGDASLGKHAFFSSSAQCSSCHKVGLRGGDFGPDLTNVGTSKSPLQLLNAILFPSAEISPEWQGWYVDSQDGKRHLGRQIDVGLRNVELMTLDGTFNTFNEPVSYGVLSTSLMPEGLENQITQQDVLNIVAFLAGTGHN